ncbi:MAG: metallophosphoesterase [Pseudomonadota bacterium]
MATLRILHTSDLHLGKRFGALPEDIRHRLRDARHDVLATLAALARQEAAAHILLAGDTFDTETPSDAVRVQALAAMADAAQMQWWLLPGNHDSLRAEPLWDALRRDAPANVHILDAAAPHALGPSAVLLPAPWPHPAPGRDLTAPLDTLPTPEGALRIGLAHGATASFHDDADRSALIPPHRATLAGLDYLALGDWHGTMEIGPRTQYSGTPERDSFRHNGPGSCLCVEIASGAPPSVRQLATGRFDWQSPALSLSPELDSLAELSRSLPTESNRRDVLIRLTATGTVSLAERGRLEAELERLRPAFGVLSTDLSALTTLATAGDLDAIARAGALRVAADDLRAAAEDTAAPADDRRIAARALDRMWTLLQDRA